MTVFNLGSINIDHIYRVPHLPGPGETLAADSLVTGLGGKGANQSVAAAKAGSAVVHIGAVGPEGGWACARLAKFGIQVSHVKRQEEPTGQAIINVDPNGENAIVIYSGANRQVGKPLITQALGRATARDLLLLQNETNGQVQAAKLARARGMKVIYSAAPFDVTEVREVLPHIDLLVLNAVEAAQLAEALGKPIEKTGVAEVIVTRGKDGASWWSGEWQHVEAFPAKAVDTTGAGDCFIGYFAAGLDQGMTSAEALRLGSAAAALQVSRHGTADAMPARAEVDALIKVSPSSHPKSSSPW